MSNICDDLRAAILQAAMQGKLTEQLPEDGDAEEVIDQIRKEKAKYNIKKKELAISKDEILFEIPDNWSWQKLENISQFLGDKNNQIKESATLKNGKYKVVSQSKELFIGYCDDEKKVLKTTSPVLVFGDHTALVKYIDFNFVIGADGVKVISPFCMNIKYLYYALKYNLLGVNELGGYSRHYKFIKDKLIPIPPLPEQERIVEKVDELMARVADLEKSADALASLKKAFPDDIKASLLQYAMQGKLTKQLSEDGDAKDLLEEIKVEKEKLVAEGKIKKQKPLAPITDDEIPFNIPENWKWVRLNDIVVKEIRRGKPPVYDKKGTSFAFAQKCNSKYNGIDLSLAKTISENSLKKYSDEDVIQALDIVVNSTGTGTLGRVGLIDSTMQIHAAYYPDSHVTIVRTPKYMSKYIYIILKNNEKYLEEKGEGSTNQKELKPLTIQNLLIPLPPVLEQKRIVERFNTILQNINAVGGLIASE